jgi:hypothetical protein
VVAPARRGSVGGGPTPGRRGSFTGRAPPAERLQVKAYWNKVVMHQGWLQKKGGVSKKWLKRYFVLYRTCMGHILCYYSDYTETALYSETAKERNVIDCRSVVPRRCRYHHHHHTTTIIITIIINPHHPLIHCSKVEFIRPVSNIPDTPPFAFDIQSIQRDWTVCAADKDDLQTWLQLVSYAVDADVGILPDDEAVFLVKPRHDPTMRLYIDEYSTFLRIHSWGITVEVRLPLHEPHRLPAGHLERSAAVKQSEQIRAIPVYSGY